MMKKNLYIFMLLITAISCAKDEHVVNYVDMMYFMEDYMADETGYISPITFLEKNPNSELNIYVVRDLMAAQLYSRQNAKIVVNKEQSTAIEGSDFTLSATTFSFHKSDIYRLPLQINIRSAAAGKTIVLQLVYEYYKECPADGRKQDRLRIKIK